MRTILALIVCLLLLSATAEAQGEFGSNKLWYSFFLKKKLAPHWELNNYLIAGFGNRHELGFVQNDLTIRYRFNTIWSVGATYKHAHYKAYRGITKIHPQPVTTFGTIIFHGASVDLRYDQRLGKNFRFSQSAIAQTYFPRFEKYQLRFISRTKFSYRNRKAPLAITPYMKFMLYYYHNGKPLNYYDESGQVEAYRSPNGFHRYRANIGFSFKPIRSAKWLGLNLYYAINREFNFSNSGSTLNVEVPSGGLNGSKTKIPFNSYEIFGVQVNVLL